MSQTDEPVDVKAYVDAMQVGISFEPIPAALTAYFGLWAEEDGSVCAKIECEWCQLGAPYRNEALPEGWLMLTASNKNQRFACPRCAEMEIPNA